MILLKKYNLKHKINHFLTKKLVIYISAFLFVFFINFFSGKSLFIF